MKDKEKQIEEMAKIVCKNYLKYLSKYLLNQKNNIYLYNEGNTWYSEKVL